MAELLSLRRKMQAVHADNALLSQNFMMVKARLSDVSAQREADQSSMQARYSACVALMFMNLRLAWGLGCWTLGNQLGLC